MTADPFHGLQPGLGSPASYAAEVTPNDESDLDMVPRALWVGSAGDLTVTMLGGVVATFPSASGWMHIRVTRVWATDTTASGIVAVW
ncbi:MAG: hypothetical protein HC900_03380 [Methylacidiphilales bacterium]|nr:hypothetical protein [Candidatus Methylacidiphilales bacterium]